MLLLALDTSTRQASIALASEENVYGEYTWHIDNNHSVELLECIQRLMAECSVAMSQLDGIAVATGPGSFNGVRVAVATAKALAFSLNTLLFGVSTLDIIASRQTTGPFCAVLEAGRSELYAACYLSEMLSTEQGDVVYHATRLSDYLLLSPEQLASYIQEQASAWVGVPGELQLAPFLFCGEISNASRQALRTQMQEQSLFINNAQAMRHASVLAACAFQRMSEGEVDDPLLLEPLYLRRPSITTSTRKQPLLGSKSRWPTGQSSTERGEGALRH